MERILQALRAIAIAALLVAGCHSDTREEAPNIILITVDTLRADHLEPYGNNEIATPAIATLAREGIVFEKAFADTSWTLPSLSSVLTGTYPSDHNVRTWNDSLASEALTLAEILRDHGYDTAAIVGSYPLDRFFGLAQGFDHYDDKMTTALYQEKIFGTDLPVTDVPLDDSVQAKGEWRSQREQSNAYRRDDEVADAAIRWLANSPSQRFFLWVHFFGPHEKDNRLIADPAKRKAHTAHQIAQYPGDVAKQMLR